MHQWNYFETTREPIVIVTKPIGRAALSLTLGASGFIIDDSVRAFGKGDSKVGAYSCVDIMNVCNNNQWICYWKKKKNTNRQRRWIDDFLFLFFVLYNNSVNDHDNRCMLFIFVFFSC